MCFETPRIELWCMYIYIYIPCNAAILLSDQNSRCNWYILGVVLFLCTSTEQTICHRVLKKYPSALVFVNFAGCNIVNLKLKFNLQQNRHWYSCSKISICPEFSMPEKHHDVCCIIHQNKISVDSLKLSPPVQNGDNVQIESTVCWSTTCCKLLVVNIS